MRTVNKKQLLLSVVLLAVLVFLLSAACTQSVPKAPAQVQVAAPTQAPAKSVVLRIASHGAEPTSGASVECYRFKKLVETASSGRIKVEVYLAGQMGSSAELPEMVRTGALEMANTVPIYFPKWGMAWANVLDLPGLFPDYVTAWADYSGWLDDMIKEDLSKAGVLGMGATDMGFRAILTRKGPIRSPADLKGMKMRTMETPILLEVWKAWGTVPTPLPWSETFQALQAGAFEGTDLVFGGVHANKMYEVTKYASYPTGAYSTYYLIANKDFFNNLSKEDQAIVTTSAMATSDFSHWYAYGEEAKAKVQLEKDGMTVTMLTPDQMKVFRDALKEVYTKAGTQYGARAAEVLNKLMSR